MGECGSKESDASLARDLERVERVARRERIQASMTTYLMISPVEQTVKGSPLMTVNEFILEASFSVGRAGMAAWLDLEFSEEVVLDRDQTLHQLGMRPGAEFRLKGFLKQEVTWCNQLGSPAEAVQASRVNVHNAAEQGDLRALRLVAEHAPDKIDALRVRLHDGTRVNDGTGRLHPVVRGCPLRQSDGSVPLDSGAS